jgi:uncharacterized protein YdaU (DUF1376 family)
MSLEAKGAYLELLIMQWREGSIPAEPDQLARMLRIRKISFGKRIWPQIVSCFVETNGRLVQRRLEQERLEGQDYLRKQENNGKRGGRPKKPKPNPSLSKTKPNHNPNERYSESESDTERTNTLEQKLEFDIEAVYQAYPRKVGKAPGLKKLRKLITTPAEYDAAMQGAKRYAEDVNRKRTDPQYILHFVTWVNQLRWMDDSELSTPRRTPGQQLVDQINAEYEENERKRIANGGAP